LDHIAKQVDVADPKENFEMYVGIDLGTSKCAAVVAIPSADGFEYKLLSIRQPSDPEDLAKVNLKSELLPSVLYINQKGQSVVGASAVRQAFYNPKRAIASSKLWLGKDITFTITGAKTPISPEDIASKFILTIVRSLGMENISISNCVIGVPACFNLKQKEEVKRAAQNAGIPSLNGMLLDEPTAAFLSIYVDKGNEIATLVNQKARCTFAVVDLGGGTLDISVIQINRENNVLVPVVLATSQRSEGAGDQFDEEIARELARKFIFTYNGFNFDGLDNDEKLRLAGDLLYTAREIKHDLSMQHLDKGSLGISRKTVVVTLKNGTKKNVPVQVTYSDIESILDSYFNINSAKSIQNQLLQVLNSFELRARTAGSRSLNPDFVILSGQMAQFWLVQECIQEILPGIKIFLIKDPQYAVAKGAAVQSATKIIQQQFLPTDLLLKTYRGFYRLAKRGSWLPLAKSTVSDALQVPSDNCSGMSIQIWQGQEEYPDQLEILREEWIQFSSPQPEGTLIGLEWSISLDFQLMLTPFLGDSPLKTLRLNSIGKT
jgi:molecular chaperone DnaK